MPNNSGEESIEVAIVGAGPVGILLACELAELGVEVVVVEQRSEPSMQSRAIGIHPPLIAVLERLGVAEELLRRAVQIRSGEVRVDGRRLGAMSFEKAGARHPFVAAVPQYETEALLRARLEAVRPGALRLGVRVHQVHDHGDRVELSLGAVGNEEVGTVSAGTGAVATAVVRAHYVVAADGARSTLRQLCGIPWTPHGEARSYLMGDFADPAVAADADPDGETKDRDEHRPAVLYFERGGVVESFPLPGARRRWVAMTDELWPDASLADLAGIIRARTGVDVAAADGAASAFVARQHLAGRMQHGRVLLIGDAAHEVSPIGGQGMNLGWLDAAALAPILARAVQDSGESASAALLEWQRRRQRSAHLAVRQAAFNMAMGGPQRGSALHARNALVRTLTLPPARTLLARAFTMRWL